MKFWKKNWSSENRQILPLGLTISLDQLWLCTEYAMFYFYSHRSVFYANYRNNLSHFFRFIYIYSSDLLIFLLFLVLLIFLCWFSNSVSFLSNETKTPIRWHFAFVSIEQPGADLAKRSHWGWSLKWFKTLFAEGVQLLPRKYT